jgi:prepilin-type N-terminal cleavage/methylation domain-containing protein
MKHKTQKGFTLIELLVVIAIIAILAIVVVLTLNPAELLRQARDSNRISDFATIKSSLALYGIDVATTTSMDSSSSATLTENLYGANATAMGQALTVFTAATTGTWGFTGATATATTNTSKAVNGTGWVPINLTAISSGAPISSWPVDPVNTATSTAYIYDANVTSWKIATMMESAKYKTTGVNDVETGDGGNSVYSYEQGSNMAL